MEVGCATGTTVRWLKNKKIYKQISYLGIDISNTVIQKAIKIHPNSNFKKVDVGPLKPFYNSYDYVFSRDTILHQEKPYEFLEELIKCSKKCLIVRTRTRDNGKTNFDIEKNCQLHYDSFWMPYIVLNINELIDFLKAISIVKSVKINRSYEVLGGNTNRFLPKDLYFTSAGGAETVIEIEIDRKMKSNNFEVSYSNHVEGRPLIYSKKYKRAFIVILKKLKILN